MNHGTYLTYILGVLLGLIVGAYLIFNLVRQLLKPKELSKNRAPMYFVITSFVLFGFSGYYFYLEYYPKEDKVFTSPDGKFKVYSYVTNDCGETRFKLVDKAGGKLGEASIDGSCYPMHEGTVIWHDDHVAINYRCTSGDCYPEYIRLDGQQLSSDDYFRFRNTYEHASLGEE